MTPVEIRICEGIMEDKTYEEIADEFGFQASWVSYQLDKIRGKLKKK
jgi:DNA-binding CsgD family transcriptional regulator